MIKYLKIVTLTTALAFASCNDADFGSDNEKARPPVTIDVSWAVTANSVAAIGA